MLILLSVGVTEFKTYICGKIGGEAVVFSWLKKKKKGGMRFLLSIITLLYLYMKFFMETSNRIILSIITILVNNIMLFY